MSDESRRGWICFERNGSLHLVHPKAVDQIRLWSKQGYTWAPTPQLTQEQQIALLNNQHRIAILEEGYARHFTNLAPHPRCPDCDLRHPLEPIIPDTHLPSGWDSKP